VKMFLFLLVIFALFICSIPSSYAQNDSCVKYYNFESSASTLPTNEWAIVPDNPHTGQKSFKSQLADGKIRSFSIKLPGRNTQPVALSFWFFIGKPMSGEKVGKLLLESDGTREFMESKHAGEWEPFIKIVKGASDHAFTWTYFPEYGEDASVWIDDICIRNTDCTGQCPEEEPAISNWPTNATTVINATTVTNATIVPTAITTAINATSKEYLVEKGIEGHSDIFSSIQSAINNVPAGSVIKVMNMTGKGPYYENLIINKTLKLISEDNAVIQSNNGIACRINDVDDVAIMGFRVISRYCGISLDNTNRCTINNNIIEGGNVGINLYNAHDSKIQSNYLQDFSWDALQLAASTNNTIEDNIINKSDWLGIYLEYSDKNNITNNSIQKIATFGILISASDDTTIGKNKFRDVRRDYIIGIDSRLRGIDMQPEQDRLNPGVIKYNRPIRS
jgi:parallel beta-helix repeat protein